MANSNDLWFHTNKIHGSHVILKTEGKNIPNDILLKCAMLAAKNSKAKSSSSVPVDYTLIKYVKKPNGAKPRNGSIFKSKNFIYKSDLTKVFFSCIFI